MKIRLEFRWFDLWIGAYWSAKDRTLYLCPFPCVVLAIVLGSPPAETTHPWAVAPGVAEDSQPRPKLLKDLDPRYCDYWVSVSEALPPPHELVLVTIRGDDFPAVAYLKFAAGDKDCPYFVCPQLAALGLRGCLGPGRGRVGIFRSRELITDWFMPSRGLPRKYSDWRREQWGLAGNGFVRVEPEPNPTSAAYFAALEAAGDARVQS